MIAESEWQRAVDLLADAQQVALACHVDPDGDALGSMLALARALRSRGVEVHASWGTAMAAPTAFAVPPQYTFLPDLGALTPPSVFPPAPALLVVFDCASPERLGTLALVARAAGTTIVLDHHSSGEAFGDVRLIDPAAPATAVLVTELLDRLGVVLDRDLATCLYVGLVTDTGRFTYPSTTAATMQLGARLIALDIDHAAINRRVWETHSFGYLKVLARALERAAIAPRAGLAWTAVSQADLAELGVSLTETEGLIDVLRAVEAADCTLVTKQQPDGAWKVSLRSKGTVDVGRLAERLGGGGHAYAAGFTTFDDPDQIVARVTAVLDGDDVPLTAVLVDRTGA